MSHFLSSSTVTAAGFKPLSKAGTVSGAVAAGGAAMDSTAVSAAGFTPLVKASTFAGRSFDRRVSFDSRFKACLLKLRHLSPPPALHRAW